MGTQRIQELERCSRTCTRREWEERYRPQLSSRARTIAIGTCSVCVEDIAMNAEVRGLSCGHVFHLQCLAQCFMQDRSMELRCPLCRVPMAQQEDRWVSL